MAQHVRDIMTGDPVTVEPQTSVAEVARIMRDEDLGVVLVTDGERLRGVVTDRDMAHPPNRSSEPRAVAPQFGTAAQVLRSGFVRFFAGDSNSSGSRRKMMSRGVHGHQ
ncbi:CBS domain-containing protein [Streptomyces massasporeus]